jgi:hypothetical protein
MTMRATKGWVVLAVLSMGMSLGCSRSATEGTALQGTEAPESSFTPPAHGQVTEEQRRMHAAVMARRDGARGATTNLARGEDLLEASARRSRADAEAARDLGYDPEEVEWILARVMEARLPEEVRLADIAARVSAAAPAATATPVASVEPES